MNIFEEIESEVRSYSRTFPTVFKVAKDSILVDENDITYIDFLMGAGSLNYGHNNSYVVEEIIHYLNKGGIIHSLDMATTAKRNFLATFKKKILIPRGLKYKVQFTGPTGTNAVEAALKLSKKVKKRSGIIAFTNGFHGLTQGSLAVSGNSYFRDKNYVNNSNVTIMPYDNYFDNLDSLGYLEKVLVDPASGIDLPAAVIVETIQGDGGINIASAKWLQKLSEICKEYDIIFIIDDIQMGNGRTGNFFSFEFANIKPDIVTLSKSLGGGLPISIVLINPIYDIWKEGEHTGTFRGNNLAFIAAIKLIDIYWSNNELSKSIQEKELVLKAELNRIVKKHLDLYSITVRGRGLVYAVEIKNDVSLAKKIINEAFNRHLIIETCGSMNHVIKFLPSLLISIDDLKKGLKIFEFSIDKILNKYTIESKANHE